MKIFVSYTSADLEFTTELVAALGRASFRVSWHVDFPGSPVLSGGIAEGLQRDIDGADLVLAVVSPLVSDNSWVLFELDYARSEGKPTALILWGDRATLERRLPPTVTQVIGGGARTDVWCMAGGLDLSRLSSWSEAHRRIVHELSTWRRDRILRARAVAAQPSTDVAQALREFGKVAVLIDDDAQARSRISLEVYGCSQAPKWWVQVRTAAAGVAAVAAVTDGQGRGALLVLDRMLPPDSLDERPRAWEQEVDATADRTDDTLQKFARAIKRLGEDRDIAVVKATMYSPRTSLGVPSWIPKSSSPVFTTLKGSPALAKYRRFGAETAEWTRVVKEWSGLLADPEAFTVLVCGDPLAMERAEGDERSLEAEVADARSEYRAGQEAVAIRRLAALACEQRRQAWKSSPLAVAACRLGFDRILALGWDRTFEQAAWRAESDTKPGGSPVLRIYPQDEIDEPQRLMGAMLARGEDTGAEVGRRKDMIQAWFRQPKHTHIAVLCVYTRLQDPVLLQALKEIGAAARGDQTLRYLSPVSSAIDPSVTCRWDRAQWEYSDAPGYALLHDVLASREGGGDHHGES